MPEGNLCGAADADHADADVCCAATDAWRCCGKLCAAMSQAALPSCGVALTPSSLLSACWIAAPPPCIPQFCTMALCEHLSAI